MRLAGQLILKPASSNHRIKSALRAGTKRPWPIIAGALDTSAFRSSFVFATAWLKNQNPQRNLRCFPDCRCSNLRYLALSLDAAPFLLKILGLTRKAGCIQEYRLHELHGHHERVEIGCYHLLDSLASEIMARAR